MRKVWFLIVGLIGMLILACGGGGDGGGGTTPTPAKATPTAVTEGTLIQMTAVNYEFTPPTIEMKVGQPYKIQMLNRGTSSFRLRIPRWDVMLFAPAGADSEVSKVFVPDTPGDYECFEEFNAARHDRRCTARVLP